MDDLDRIVNTITERIKSRLQQLPAPNPSVCTSASTECSACGQCVTKKSETVKAIIGSGASRIGASQGVQNPDTSLAHYIDHTLLKPEATREELKKICDEARQYNFYSVCVNSANVRYCKSLLEGTPVKVVAVVGFPLGAMTINAKAYEAKEAIRNGAEEIDMVLNIGAMKSKDFTTVLKDIIEVVHASNPKPVKVIIETSKLSDEEKVIASTLSKIGGARFVKTSTGFGGGGATVADILLIRATIGNDMEIKASGGIRTQEDAKKMIAAGANRIGASASVEIIKGQTIKKGDY